MNVNHYLKWCSVRLLVMLNHYVCNSETGKQIIRLYTVFKLCSICLCAAFPCVNSCLFPFQTAILETNPYLLGLTIVVSIVHSVFEFLAFKNGKSFHCSGYSIGRLNLKLIPLIKYTYQPKAKRLEANPVFFQRKKLKFTKIQIFLYLNKYEELTKVLMIMLRFNAYLLCFNEINSS